MQYRYLLAFTPLLMPATSFPRPIEQSRMLPKIQQLDASGRRHETAPSTPVFQAATAGTTFYGGTFWAADSMRWEAYENQLWTFDSGVGSSMVPPGGVGDLSAPTSSWVNPYKSPGLHATMEGWIGFDVTYSEITYFRRIAQTDPRFGTTKCVGTQAGLQGTTSFWCGVFPAEANVLCYGGGQGYGNMWNTCIEHSFDYPGGNAQLSFQYKNDTEDSFDYVYVFCDRTGNGDLVELAAYTGNVSGTANLLLQSGTTLPPAPGVIKLMFCVASDGAWSDQDGLNPTACGAFAVDNIVLTGAITHTATFETSNDGWILSAPQPGRGGDWSNLYSLNDLPPTLATCSCALTDSVLAFPEGNGMHNIYKDNLAASPWIDLKAYGKVGATGKLIRTNLYATLPLLNYIFIQFNAQWYPEKCLQTGKLVTSPWTSNGFVYYFGGTPTCTSTQPGTIGTQIEFSGYIPPGAEQIRIAVGVLSYCRFFANCTQTSNTTPWIDLAGLGVYGNPNVPYVFTDAIGLAQDNFPKNGLLQLNGPGRIDSNNVQGDSQPEVHTTLGDTLVVLCPTANAEVYVHFKVTPGPGTHVANFNAWYNSHAASPINGSFKRARCDTAEFGASGPILGSWMTAYHESDPNFAAHGANDRTLDTNDYAPDGGLWRLSHDIFPDNLFTGGTHIDYFFSASMIGSSDYSVDPPTAPELAYEVEILPALSTHDRTYNCILYVDHAGGEAQPVIEEGLRWTLGTAPGNFEQTRWDRYDVNAPSSQQASLGRPQYTDYGATLYQLLYGYRVILWDSGDLNAFNLTKEDGDVLVPWLGSYPQFPDKNLYLSGNGVVYSAIAEGNSEPSARWLVEDVAGATILTTCASGTFRRMGCPVEGAPEDLTPCVNLQPMPHARVAGFETMRVENHVAQGNGCPELRSFDVLDAITPIRGVTFPDEIYVSPLKSARYSSVAMDNQTTYGRFKSVVDGVSVAYRRDEGSACDFATGGQVAVTERLREVLEYFGFATGYCPPPRTTGIPPVEEPLRTLLSGISPNPLMAGATVRIRFSMAQDAPALLEILDVQGRLVKSLFNGTAKKGSNEATWDGRDNAGTPVGSGVYFYRLKALDQDISRKMVVVGRRN